MTILAGIDIGGTKCAVSLGRAERSNIRILAREAFPTPSTPEAALKGLSDLLIRLLAAHGAKIPAAIGVSCGGPLDSRAGLILSPPNLPGWDGVQVVSLFQERFTAPVALQNDANACALAEWRWGAGRGCRNVVFLTFGTGMGAGLILDGRLYGGTNDMAGEVGHMRLEPEGPEGYGKAGSFEGFCSGGGIARLARSLALGQIQKGLPCAFCTSLAAAESITAAAVTEAAAQGDSLAREIFTIVARQLGRGLAVLVDIVNPERIVLGSIYVRQRPLLYPILLETLRAEALPRSLSACRIVPAALGEQVGDYASLAVALDHLSRLDQRRD
jgi:glucokinase